MMLIYIILYKQHSKEKQFLCVCNVSLLKLKLCLTENAFELQKCQRHLLEVRKVVCYPSENMTLQMFIIIKIQKNKTGKDKQDHSNVMRNLQHKSI